MIRECTGEDRERIYFVINEAAQAYKGSIPDDCWHEPYMPMEELQREMQGMTFFGWDEGEGLVGVMGYQPLEDVTLIRHAYVLSGRQGEGIGGRLVEHLRGMTTTRRLLVGTWAAAIWAIRFYEKQGFRLRGDGQELLKRYWDIPSRQVETSVVLGLPIRQAGLEM